MTDEAVKTLEHYIEGPRMPVLQEKQVFLVLKKPGLKTSLRHKLIV